MKNWFWMLIVALFVSHASALDWDTIGEVEDDEVAEEVKPAPAPVVRKEVEAAPVMKKKVAAKASTPSDLKWSMNLIMNPLATQQGYYAPNGLNPNMVEGNTVVGFGLQMSPAYRLLANLGYNSTKNTNTPAAPAVAITSESSLISLGLGMDYFLKSSDHSNFYMNVGLSYLMAKSIENTVTTDATGYVLAVGLGSEFNLGKSFSIGLDLAAKYGVGTKAADVPVPGTAELKSTVIWLAPALRLTWNI